MLGEGHSPSRLEPEACLHAENGMLHEDVPLILQDLHETGHTKATDYICTAEGLVGQRSNGPHAPAALSFRAVVELIKRVQSAMHGVLVATFLPKGYPKSVASEYRSFQVGPVLPWIVVFPASAH